VPYELNVFRRIQQEILSPLYFPLEPAEQAAYYDQLNHTPSLATKQVHAQFHALDDLPPVLKSLRVQLLDQHPLPVFVAQNHTVYPNEATAGEDLLSQMLSELSIAKESILEWYHWQDERGGLHLELFAQYPLDSLTAEERRYYFYQCLMDEQLAAIQDSMVQHVHQTSSRKEVRKYVQDHQRDLLTYASEVLDCLNEAQTPVYAAVEDYSLPDVYRLIYSNLEELLAFLEQQFKQYLDQNAKAAESTVDPTRSEEQSDKIKTNFSVPELSLLIRTLFEVEAFVNQKEKAHVYRHFSRIFDSQQKEDISYNTLRNSQYRPDRHTIVSLKEKIIAMMNFLNSL
jgi:hypothetical protein